MKKLFAMLLAIIVVISLTACGTSGNESTKENEAGTKQEKTSEDSKAKWPGSKTVNIIVPYGAGGDTDFNARLLATKLTEKTGANFIVTNVNGNAGATGSIEAKNAANDGTTILFHHTAFLINNIYGSTDFLFDNAFDFSCVVGRSAGNIITMNANLGIKTLDDLIKYTKAHPNELKFTANTGATTHATALFLQQIGCEIQLVDAGSASERIGALLGGHVDIIDNAIGTIKDYLATGELVAICSDSDIQNPLLMKDYGIGIGKDQGYDIGLPFIYFCAFPYGTDPEIVETFSALCKDIIENDKDYQDQLAQAYCQEPFYYDTKEGYKVMMDAYEKLKGLDFGNK